MDRKRGREDDDGPATGGAEGGEIALSIEETNKLRISLGLKPLNFDAPKVDEEARRRGEEARKKREQEERAQQFKARQAEKRQKAAQDEFLAVKGLGEADEDDDMQSWVEKQRVADVARRAEERFAAREKAQKEAAKQSRRQQDSDDEGAGANGHSLEGLKVRHDYNDLLHEGQEVVLTLVDKGILDERGRGFNEAAEEDELENVLKAEDRKRQKAREAAAPKAKPLWEEDGKRRGLLDKYDEEEQDVVFQLGADGSVDAERLKRQEEVRKRLAEAGKTLESAAVGVLAPGATGGLGELAAQAPAVKSEYYTEAELAAQKEKKEKRKKERKERKIRAKSAEPGDEEGGTAALIEQLEAAAEVAGGGLGTSELGSRTGRTSAREKAEAALRQSEIDRRARFENAVAKGNWASAMLKPGAQGGVVGEEEDDADRELRESLARARRLAAAQAQQLQPAVKAEGEGQDQGEAAAGAGPRSSLEEIAAAAARKREEDEARLKEELRAAAAASASAKGGLSVVNDTIEFVRNIQVKMEALPTPQSLPGGASVAAGALSRLPPPPPPPPKATADKEDDYMDLDKEDQEGGKPSKPAAPRGWVAAGAEGSPGPGEGADMDMDAGDMEEGGDEAGGGRGRRAASEPRSEEPEQEEEGDSVVREKSVGKGLAATLALLKNKGDLDATKQIQWAGRTNDKSKNALQGILGDVYKGGSHDDRLERSIEVALTIKDEFGRVLTPKERWRQLNYDFHGKKPSLNKEALRLRKAAEEIERRKHATSEVAEGGEVQGLSKVTEKVAQPYVVLQGKGAMETLKAAGLTTDASGGKGGAGAAGKAGGSGAKGSRPGSSGAAGKGGGGSKGGSKPPLAPPPRGPPGAATPLLGDRKVEAMLGIRKPA